MTFTLSPACSGSSVSPSSAPSASELLRPASTSSAISSVDEARIASAAALVGTLRRLENLLDETLVAGGELTGALVQARTSHGLSAVVGHKVFEAISQAQDSITQARGHVVAGHRLLDRVADAIGMDPSAFGDTGKPAVAIFSSKSDRDSTLA